MSEEKVKVGSVNVNNNWKGHGAWGGAYGLAFLGAFIYYLQNSDTFWIGVLGFLKALVWPAFLIYHIYGLLRM